MKLSSREFRERVSKGIKNMSIEKRKKWLKKTKRAGFQKGMIPWNKDQKLSPEFVTKLKESHIGKSGWKHKASTKKLMRQRALNRIILPEQKIKFRTSRIAYIQKTQFGNKVFRPTIGKFEKQYLDEIELSNNIQIQRDFTCIGFFPDGYHKDSNTIIEVDEPRHSIERFKRKDLFREKELIKELNCNIVRVKI